MRRTASGNHDFVPCFWDPCLRVVYQVQQLFHSWQYWSSSSSPKNLAFLRDHDSSHRSEACCRVEENLQAMTRGQHGSESDRRNGRTLAPGRAGTTLFFLTMRVILLGCYMRLNSGEFGGWCGMRGWLSELFRPIGASSRRGRRVAGRAWRTFPYAGHTRASLFAALNQA